MKKKWLSILTLLALSAGLAACGANGADKPAEKEGGTAETVEASGDWKPEENVTTIVAYKAGSGTDTTARILSEFANKYLGKTMVIENLEGGSGSIGWTRLAESKPDGYTIGYVNLRPLHRISSKVSAITRWMISSRLQTTSPRRP